MAHHFFIHRQVMVSFIRFRYSLQDAQSQIRIRFFQRNLLQFGNHLLISFDMFGITVNRRGTQERKFAFTEFLLQNRRSSIQVTLLIKELVYLFNDKNRVVLLPYFFQKFLETVFHLSFIGSIGSQQRIVQFISLGTFQKIWDIPMCQLDTEAID